MAPSMITYYPQLPILLHGWRMGEDQNLAVFAKSLFTLQMHVQGCFLLSTTPTGPSSIIAWPARSMLDWGVGWLPVP